MKKNSIIAILAAAILIAGIFTAGCTQNTGSGANPSVNSSQSSSGNSQQYTPSSGGRQFGGQSFLTNETLLAATAGKLGVSEQDLKNALNNTKNATSGRPDFAAAAQQLGVTSEQLMNAMGFSSGGRVRSGGYNATQTPGQ